MTVGAGQARETREIAGMARSYGWIRLLQQVQ